MAVRTGFTTTLPYGRGSVFVHSSTLSIFLSRTHAERAADQPLPMKSSLQFRQRYRE